MKRIILFFAVCLGLSVSGTTFATNEETVRAATKRTSATNVSTTTNSNRSVSVNSRKTDSVQNKNSRTAIKTQPQKVVSRTTTTKNVKARTTNQQSDNLNVAKRTSAPTRTSARTLSVKKLPITVSNTNARIAITGVNRKSSARTAELNTEKINNIKSADYSKCKSVYYECMDEFCANKDSNLRRCACSSRIHEFDNIKKQLDDAEDKMTSFNQRLLTVSMDKEDAAALNVATEGETAFQIADKTESEKLLQKITNALNTSSDSKITNDLSSISLSLDMDSAWDNLDALSGISTTAKSGIDLYNAAEPVCIEMAKEVCSDEELSIAQDGYKLTIQQDCNTVAKSYTTLYNNAMDKIHESGALLDISRLSVYQQKNADDILTCKKKILTQLYDASVCGENLYKCLDMTGEYIDPSNGNAFLSSNLYNLSNLLQEPVGDEKWSKLTQNEPFVNFLNTKKEFLKPAMKQCEDISDTVWREFLDDALSQIKLAQNAKMEEIRQGCTTLVAECKTNALTDLAEFDSRALSLFSVSADKTANTMCSDIQNACVALINNMNTTDWESGMVGIATNISYDTVMDTCAQIGRDCIIQKCNGTLGNFALCTGTTSQNRADILNRNACWTKVYNCVQSADNLTTMTGGILPASSNITYDDARENYYYSLYSINNFSSVPVFCSSLTGTELTACLIAEQIWGNCADTTDQTDATILQSNDSTSLLSWFATNTGNLACNSTACPAGYQLVNNTCQQTISQTTTDCATATLWNQIIHVNQTITNHCASGIRDSFGNCCVNGYTDNGICTNAQYQHAILLLQGTCSAANITNQAEFNYYCPNHNPANPRVLSTYCVSADSYITYDADNDSYICNGVWTLVDQYGNYFDYRGVFTDDAPKMKYKPDCNTTCQYGRAGNVWTFQGGTNCFNAPVPTNEEFLIEYE